jgi:hypothetical protein
MLEAYTGTGGIAPLILKFATSWMWVAHLTPQRLTHLRYYQMYPLNRRLFEPQCLSIGGCVGPSAFE